MVLVYTRDQVLSQSQLYDCVLYSSAICSYAVFDDLLKEATGEATSASSGFFTSIMSDEVSCSWSASE